MGKYDHLVNKEQVENKDDPESIRTPQNYVVFSYVSPDSGGQSCNISALKVRGCFETEEGAKKHAEVIQGVDKNFDVWVMQMWKWCPFPPTPGEGECDMKYANDKLSGIMDHINNEKMGRNKEFIDRMEALTTAETAPYSTST